MQAAAASSSSIEGRLRALESRRAELLAMSGIHVACKTYDPLSFENFGAGHEGNTSGAGGDSVGTVPAGEPGTDDSGISEPGVRYLAGGGSSGTLGAAGGRARAIARGARAGGGYEIGAAPVLSTGGGTLVGTSGVGQRSSPPTAPGTPQPRRTAQTGAAPVLSTGGGTLVGTSGVGQRSSPPTAPGTPQPRRTAQTGQIVQQTPRTGTGRSTAGGTPTTAGAVAGAGGSGGAKTGVKPSPWSLSTGTNNRRPGTASMGGRTRSTSPPLTRHERMAALEGTRADMMATSTSGGGDAYDAAVLEHRRRIEAEMEEHARMVCGGNGGHSSSNLQANGVGGGSEVRKVPMTPRKSSLGGRAGGGVSRVTPPAVDKSASGGSARGRGPTAMSGASRNNSAPPARFPGLSPPGSDASLRSNGRVGGNGGGGVGGAGTNKGKTASSVGFGSSSSTRRVPGGGDVSRGRQSFTSVSPTRGAGAGGRGAQRAAGSQRNSVDGDVGGGGGGHEARASDPGGNVDYAQGSNFAGGHLGDAYLGGEVIFPGHGGWGGFNDGGGATDAHASYNHEDNSATFPWPQSAEEVAAHERANAQMGGF
eukprot:TRINITY_DN6037_c0_g1_i1.p1 TRINITY_DN6037_c0_g1~~TRINITY_DN6037_c0_g1_i1.p1  ORF type:complete len:656 (-),score=114.18 TRINITY_DN6037_c0_g1_i1:66-1838(-)